MLAANLNSLGLFLDIIGVVILFKFGLPENIDRSGKVYRILEHKDEAEERKVRFYDKMALVAVGLLIVGFILQGVSNYL